MLVLGPQQTLQITGNAFEFPFNLTGKFTKGFYSVTTLSWLWANQQLLKKQQVAQSTEFKN